ncbi:MAG TPA: TonB-dependent receptor [Vicinamibacterales bacterium]|nr:TonB-dependent receptor [Vicinamibacterales bacterium]
MWKWFRSVAFLVAFAAAGAPAYAQNALITGALTDQSGAVLPGVTVTARNQETGLTRTAVSGAAGDYRLPALPPGTYTLKVELSGFTTEERSGIILVIDQTAQIDFTLKPAAVAETVTVQGESPIVDVTASNVATSVSNAQIQDLPVASRRWIDLAMLTPGTSQDNIRGFFYRGNVNVGAGTREYSNGFVVDGVNNTWAEMGEPRQNFAMDSIREFKVSTSNYKAEYGLATGGLVTVVSKSGTNDLHGSGLLFFRDKSLTSRTHFESEKPDFERYQYGGTIGGPIIRDRTHFFFAYEGTQESQFFTVNTAGIWPNADGTYPSEQDRWTYTAKVDHQLADNQSVFFRYAQEDEYRPIITAGGRTHPTASFDFAVPRSSAVLAHTWVVNDRMLNDFRFQYGFSKYEVAPPYSHGSWEPGYFGEDRLAFCLPVFSYPSLQLGGCGNTQMGPETRWQFKDDYSYLMPAWGGRHQWKVGVDYSYIEFQADNFGSPLGSWTSAADEEFSATNSPTQFNHSLPTYADIPVHHFSTYVQDDWQVASRVTLNLGLRYDLQVGVFNEDIPGLLQKIEDKLGRDGSFPIEVPFHEGYQSRGDRNNFGPRVGLAWDPFDDGRTNIRAAYGIFYDNIRTLTNFGELTWPQAKSIVIRNPSYPDPYNGQSREEFLSTAPPNITVGDHDQVNPYAHQLNFGASHMLTRTMAVTADVTFVNRYSDRDTVDINLPDPTTKQRPYPQFNRVSYWQSTADNTYRALLLKVERRLSDGYQFLASYTLSQAKDDNFSNNVPDVYGFAKTVRYGAADRRHRLVVSGIVQLPFEMQVSAIGDFRSSLPFGPSSPLDPDGDGYTGDLPTGVEPNSGCRDLDLAAVNAFRRSRNLSEVGSIECPGFANLDLRFSKFLSLPRGHRVELIAQLFNVFNRANFGVPTGGLTSSLFGQPTALLPNINAPSRQVELAIRYQF